VDLGAWQQFLADDRVLQRDVVGLLFVLAGFLLDRIQFTRHDAACGNLPQVTDVRDADGVEVISPALGPCDHARVNEFAEAPLAQVEMRRRLSSSGQCGSPLCTAWR
jgi:hypothetical protein